MLFFRKLINISEGRREGCIKWDYIDKSEKLTIFKIRVSVRFHGYTTSIVKQSAKCCGILYLSLANIHKCLVLAGNLLYITYWLKKWVYPEERRESYPRSTTKNPPSWWVFYFIKALQHRCWRAFFMLWERITITWFYRDCNLGCYEGKEIKKAFLGKNIMRWVFARDSLKIVITK